MSKCKDIGCKTNDPNSKVICQDCMLDMFKKLSVDEIYELYYNITILLKMSPRVKELLIYMFGQEEVDRIDDLKEGWFDFVNMVLLLKDKRG